VLKETRSTALDTLRNRYERPEEDAMDLDDFIITGFCVVEEAIPAVPCWTATGCGSAARRRTWRIAR
jgi:hypothetical protein